MLHKDMVLGDCVIGSNKFRCDCFPGLIKALHVGVTINPADIIADNAQVGGMGSGYEKGVT